jgi:pseudaminic acid cytidylyltransferase
MNIAIIPARGGSKRIPGKNIKNFAGKPIISYSIEAAIKSEIFDRVIVSTDCKRIAEISRKEGADVPFMRPKELSDDMTPTAPVVEHAIRWFQEQGDDVKYACCIYPTAPFVRSEDLITGYEFLVKSKSTGVFSVTEFDFTIFRALKISKYGCLEMIWPEHELTRSQDLPKSYHDAGQFYWVDSLKFLEEKKLYAKDSRPVILPRILVQDIDTAEDWEVAEIMYETCKKKGLL